MRKSTEVRFKDLLNTLIKSNEAQLNRVRDVKDAKNLFLEGFLDGKVQAYKLILENLEFYLKEV